MHQKDYNGALEDLDKALQLDQSDRRCWNARGLVRLKAGKFEEASQDFGKAIELQNDEPEYWNNRGLARARLE